MGVKVQDSDSCQSQRPCRLTAPVGINLKLRQALRTGSPLLQAQPLHLALALVREDMLCICKQSLNFFIFFHILSRCS
jgi:hypothetical protein